MAGPLKSLKVLDFSTLLPGPYATMLLADMGAEVLRIEAPDRVDLTKVMPPFDGKFSTAFSYLTRGKDTLQLNLKKEGAADKVKELVRDFDIVVEQFRPGVMDRLGHRLTDQPAAQAMPDHQDALAQEIAGIVDLAFDPQYQPGLLLSDFQLHGHHGLEQSGELEGLAVDCFQIGAVDDEGTHGRERTRPGPAWTQAHEFIPGAVPEHLHQPAELVTADPCHLDTQQIRRNPGLFQHLPGVQPLRLRTDQSCLHKMF